MTQASICKSTTKEFMLIRCNATSYELELTSIHGITRNNLYIKHVPFPHWISSYRYHSQPIDLDSRVIRRCNSGCTTANCSVACDDTLTVGGFTGAGEHAPPRSLEFACARVACLLDLLKFRNSTIKNSPFPPLPMTFRYLPR